MPAESLDEVVSLCKRRGFVFQGSSVYGGMANSWDYGPLGGELKNNVKRAWWQSVVYDRDDMEGLDAAIIMNRKVWKYSGHEATFSDPLVDNKKTKKRYRLDHLLGKLSDGQRLFFVESLVETAKKQAWTNAEHNYCYLLDWIAEQREITEKSAILGVFQAHVHDIRPVAQSLNDINSNTIRAATQEAVWSTAVLRTVLAFVEKPSFALRVLNDAKIPDPLTGEPGDWTEPRLFNLMFETFVGPVKDEDNKAYLRPETAQGIFVNFKNILDTMRRKPPFGVAQIGKAFRNEITPGNFTFRTREFEQMEIEFFIPPPPYAQGEKTDDEWHKEWVEQRYQWYLDLGVARSRLHQRVQDKNELAHYAKACTDLEYKFPGSLGFSELEGIANRTDFDLTAHSKEVPDDDAARARLKLPKNPDSVESLTYFDADFTDPVTGKKGRHSVPYVIEPSAGADRATLAFLCEAYNVEPVGEVPQADAAKLREQIEAFLKSAAKNETLSAEQKAAIATLGQEIVAGGPARFPSIPRLLELPGASAIVLGEKLRNAAAKLIEQHFRTVLKLNPRLSPIKVAVFPLKKNEPRIVEMAHKIKSSLARHWRVVYDETGAIGKLYRRQDEIGTPFCITVDFQSLEDNTVTVRVRDSMAQERLPVNARDGEESLLRFLARHLGHAMGE